MTLERQTEGVGNDMAAPAVDWRRRVWRCLSIARQGGIELWMVNKGFAEVLGIGHRLACFGKNTPPERTRYTSGLSTPGGVVPCSASALTASIRRRRTRMSITSGMVQQLAELGRRSSVAPSYANLDGAAPRPEGDRGAVVARRRF